MTQFERFYPDANDSDKRGRFKVAQCFADAMKQYIVDGCPALPKEEEGRTDYMWETQEQQVHQSMHLPKKTKFVGA